MNSKNVIKQRIALACRIMYSEGLREAQGFEFAGHISVRLPGQPNLFVMPGHLHEKGRGFSQLRINDMIVVDMDGKRIQGSLDPVEEVVIHSYIYRARPEINSVVHMHPPAATALGSTRQSILPISLKSSLFADGVPILKRGPRLIDNDDIAKEMIEVMGEHKVLIHKGHGIVTAGRNLEEACLLAVFLEGSAKSQILAALLGEIDPFDTASALRFKEKMNLAEHPEMWQYFERKWKKYAAVPSNP
ncbi:MAG TPA: class II aldolase/adducin family protein [Nitrososphaerales archaeon]|nr:class II aldolase/adducin family protein [Nitrososphaerales archaeon]